MLKDLMEKKVTRAVGLFWYAQNVEKGSFILGAMVFLVTSPDLSLRTCDHQSVVFVEERDISLLDKTTDTAP